MHNLGLSSHDENLMHNSGSTIYIPAIIPNVDIEYNDIHYLQTFLQHSSDCEKQVYYT